MIFGGIEAGGTKWVCAVGGGHGDIRDELVFSTTGPDETIARAVAFFSQHEPLAALGLGSFGPIDVRRDSPTWGRITTTPKPGWSGVDLATSLGDALAVAVGLDTDVNAAALAEHRWGAAVGLDTFSYITIGTGIGGGGMSNGRLMHGLLHPEVGHMRVPHQRDRDPFDGICPYHGDCLEGLASGEAMRARWGRPAAEIDDEDAWLLEADYLALGLANLVCTVSPQRIVVGGGVMKQPVLLPLLRSRVRDLAAGYIAASELADGVDDYIVAPALGDRAGVLGALELARLAYRAEAGATTLS
jgi:fructokinase